MGYLYGDRKRWGAIIKSELYGYMVPMMSEEPDGYTSMTHKFDPREVNLLHPETYILMFNGAKAHSDKLPTINLIKNSITIFYKTKEPPVNA